MSIGKKVNSLVLSQGISPNEIEFIAEETIVTVTSSIDHDQFNFISGTFGPLEAGLPCKLPLWLALTLRKRGKCTINIPEWLNCEHLEECVQHERRELVFVSIPFHYVEISKLLIHHAREDFPQPDKLIALLQDLENIRVDRMKLAMQSMADNLKTSTLVRSAKVTNVSAMEIFAVKDFLSELMNVFSNFSQKLTEREGRRLNESGNTTANENPTNRRLRRFRS